MIISLRVLNVLSLSSSISKDPEKQNVSSQRLAFFAGAKNSRLVSNVEEKNRRVFLQYEK
jgi:hypothetical protein